MSVQDTSSNSETKAPPLSAENPWYIRSFTKTLICLGVGGGAAALFVPFILWFCFNMDPIHVDQLRLHLLYLTGGIIAILTLLQTNWKNQVDRRRKVDADIKKYEEDVKKNDRDHIRQVQAERRGRYTKAVEQLGDEKAIVRLGGIYTLVSLVDEWFTDEGVDIIVGKKEGQAIIDTLCAYIRSPFPLAENKHFLEKKNPTDNELKKYNGDFTADQKKLREEQNVRRAILGEITSRCKISEALDEDGNESIYSELWPSFSYDFSYATFFYPVYFYGVFFKSTIDFSDAIFKDYTNFSNSIFLKHTSFSSTIFEDLLDFSQTYFESPTYFEDATFHNISNFESSLFSESNFSRAKFNSIATFKDSCFDKSVNFDATVFTNVDFSNANFKESTDFNNTKFKGSAFFDGSTINNRPDADSE